jgi:hypothetical protein
MTYTTVGLTNNGRTPHYQIQYDDTLSQADGVDRANALIAVCEGDFTLMSDWFDNIALTVGIPITVQIAPGSYASASWGPPITLIPGNGSSITVVRYLLVSEVTEMFMLAQNKGWFGAGNEGSAGEGLSRFLAGQFLISKGLGVTEPGFSLANSWMNTPRADYVNNIDVTDHGIDAKTGCSILFIYYMHTQLGYGIKDIIAAAASELSSVYKNLTGDPSDPFLPFKNLLDTYYPGTTTIPGTNPDNPFPLGPYRRLPQRTGDLDGDEVDEILVSSPWGIGILKELGATMNALMLQPNGTRFGDWLLNTADNRFGSLADYNGDGRAEVFVSSPWGIGFLELVGSTLTSTGMSANGTAIGGWTLNTAENQFGPVADYDGDGTVVFFVSSAFGLGLLKLSGGALSALLVAPNGTRFGGWLLGTANNQFGPAADYDGDGQAEVFVTSPWGVGILKLSNGVLSAMMLQPNGTRFGGWLLNTADNQFGPAADYDGDGQAEVFVSSPWGIGILKLSGGTMNAIMLQPNGTRFGGWLLNTADNRFGPAANYDNGTASGVFVSSPWGVGILKLFGSTMSAPMMQPNGTRFGGWLLNTADNHFMATGHFANGVAPTVLVTSPWGIGLLEQIGSTMNAPMLQPNGTRFNGWLLNTADNTL